MLLPQQRVSSWERRHAGKVIGENSSLLLICPDPRKNTLFCFHRPFDLHLFKKRKSRRLYVCILILCLSTVDCWLERYHPSHQTRYLNATTVIAKIPIPRFTQITLNWGLDFLLLHPTTGKLFEPQHTDSNGNHLPVANLSSHMVTAHSSFPSREHLLLTSTAFFFF